MRRTVYGKKGFVRATIDSEDEESDRHDTDDWDVAYQVRTDSTDALDDDGYRQGLIDADRDRRMTNHKRPLTATKQQRQGSKRAPAPRRDSIRRDGISPDAHRRMTNHLHPLKFSK